MTNRQSTPAISRTARSGDGAARTLRDNLATIKATGSSGAREARFQFRCLKRLTLPRHKLSHRFATNV